MLWSLKTNSRIKSNIIALILMVCVSAVLFALGGFYKEYFYVFTTASVLLFVSVFGLCILLFHKIYRYAELGGLVSLVVSDEKNAKSITAPNGRIVYNNNAAIELWQNSHPYDFFAANLEDDEDAREALETLKQASLSCVKAEVKIAIKRKESPTTEWFEVSVAPLGFVVGAPNNSKPDYYLWRVKDISFIAIAKTIEQEWGDLSDFLDFSPIGMYLADSDGNIQYLNTRLTEWLGYKSKTDFFDEKEKIGDIVEGSLPEQDGQWRGELAFRAKSGAVFHAFVDQSVYDYKGDTWSRAVVVRHVIPEREMEHKFRTLQRRMRLLFEDAPIGVAFTNLKREVVDANNYLARLSKKPKEELSGISLEKLLEEDDYKDLNSKLSEIQSGEQKSFIMEVRLKNPNNKKASKESVVTLYANPMLKYVSDIDIETEGFVLHFLDKTDQKQLEEQFAQAQKMQAMGKIAGSVAHDFNNILTAIIGFCDFLKQRHGPRDPSFPDITQISDNAHRAAKLASKLLAFSRTQPMRPRVVNVTDTFVDRIYTFLRGLIGDTIDIDMVHGKDVGYIRVDLMQLELVFMNLATNARDAMPSGGTITISTKVKKFDEPIQNVNDIIPDGEFVAIKFKDSGEGIPKENIEHIFEPFFTTKKDKQSGRTANSGTGLGLSMVYGTVKQMGGFIEVESTVGEGTAFIIYLPRFSSIPKEEIIKVEKSDDSESIIKVKREIDIEEQEQLSIPLDMPETEQQNGEKDAPTELSGSGVILFVEDEPAVRAFGTRALRDKGYDVMESDCGESALEMLEEKGIEKIDLLVTDMMMPGIDGVTLAKKLKSRIEGLKVILISGYSEDIARDDLADSPDFHFLAKPFSLKEFATEVKRVIDNE